MKKLPFILMTVLIIAALSPCLSAETTLTGKITDVRFSRVNSTDVIEILLDKYTSYTSMRIPDPDRIVIDIEGVSAPGKQQILETGSRFISRARYAQFDSRTSRVVIEAKENPEFKVEKISTGIRIILSGQPTDEELQESAEREEASDNNNSRTLSKKVTINKSISVEYSLAGPKETISFKLPAYKGYNIIRLTGPDRIVLDIPGITSTIGASSLAISGTRVSAIRYSRYGKSTLRIVLDTAGQPYYTVDERKGMLVITIEAQGFKNIKYSNNGDRVYLNIAGAALTQQRDTLIKYYSGKYDSTGKVYTLTFSSGLNDLGDGTLKINDDFLNYIDITTDEEKQTTTVIFNSKGKFKFLPYYRSEVKSTNITVLEPALKGQKLVVIDPGHGGIMPGATYGSMEEKDLNLDIAKRLDRLLEAKKARTYMIREDDSYVDNFERAYIANTLDAALYIGVHNNAMDDPSFKGTMTLYFPQSGSGFNGKVFAQLVHDRLLYRLRTTNRKVLERPNLVVLKETRMPSVLAEVAFMTNKTDRTNLMNAQFREKAALAISEGVMQALAKVR